ncbi:hypothetical protein Tco_0567162 [Tanacetum coccineum]
MGGSCSGRLCGVDGGGGKAQTGGGVSSVEYAWAARGVEACMAGGRWPDIEGGEWRGDDEIIKVFVCTDKAKITRKQSKPDKHGHGNRRARKKSGCGGSYQSQTTVNPLVNNT